MAAAAALPLDALREHVPSLDAADARLIEDGWDSWVYAAGPWIFRIPRRPEVEEAIEAEIAFLAELAPALPAAVPRYEIVVRDGVTCAGYRRIGAEPLRPPAIPALARDLGGFLAALHRFPADRAVELGIPAEDWRAAMGELLAAFTGRVVPLLEPRERAVAKATFERFLADARSFGFEPAVIHADLGPEHILTDEGGRLAGVIDWTDARVGDPALDFAWLLHATGERFQAALLRGYGGPVDASFRARAAFFHLLGPWHEVTYGLDTGRPAFVERGLAGVRDRLP